LAAVSAILTKYTTVTQFDPLDRSDRYKFEILKIQDFSGRHPEKSQNRDISATV